MESDLWYIIGAIIAAVIALIFGKKKAEEQAVNSAKIPDAVKQWESAVATASSEFGVPPAVLMAMLWVESAGNQNARGSAGEYGLMQVKPIAIRDLKLQGFGEFRGWKTDPMQNIRAGAAYLRRWYNQTDNWYEAVKAYNQGLQGAKKYPEKASAYLEKVKAKEKFFS